MNAPDYIGNAISEYSICKKDRIPGIPDEKRAGQLPRLQMLLKRVRTRSIK